MSKTVLKTNQLYKSFGGVKAVQNFSFEVHEGDVIAIIGPNGAGKTTIFNVISKIYTPDSGTIEFDGKDVTAMSQVDIARMGISRTFQNTRLFTGLNVINNVKVALDFSGKYSLLEALILLPRRWKVEREITDRAMECLKLLSLDQYALQKPEALPYGIQRRVEIARALVSNPKVLMLDEPAAGLNPEEVLQLMDFIAEIKEKYPALAILIIEHRMDLVMNISDYIYVQDFGETIAQGLPKEIQSNPDVLTAYLGEEG